MILKEDVYLAGERHLALAAEDLSAPAFVRQLVELGVVVLEEIEIVLEYGADLGVASLGPLLLDGDAASGERPARE